MADIILQQAQSVPATMRTRYRDMGDGTHALCVVLKTGTGGFTLRQAQSIPPNVKIKYQDMGDGTHAIVYAGG